MAYFIIIHKNSGNREVGYVEAKSAEDACQKVSGKMICPGIMVQNPFLGEMLIYHGHENQIKKLREITNGFGLLEMIWVEKDG